MKNLTLTLFFSFFSITAFTQRDEFQIYPNGLIYNETTMQYLNHIVDSLNLKFKSCDLNKAYYSKRQAKGHYFSLEIKSNNAIKDIENNISFEDFIKKYPKTIVKKNQLAVKNEYTSYTGAKIFEINIISLDGGYEIDLKINENDYLNDNKTKWKYYQSKRSIRGFFSEEGFSSSPIPETYAKMI